MRSIQIKWPDINVSLLVNWKFIGNRKSTDNSFGAWISWRLIFISVMKAFPTAWLVFPEKLFFLPGIGRLVGDVVLLDRIRNIQRLLPADAHRCRVDERHRYVLWSGRNRTWKEARENVSWILRNILIKVIHFNVYYCPFHLRPLNRAPGALSVTSWKSFKREFCFRKKR